jgi:hypothetical protein
MPLRRRLPHRLGDVAEDVVQLSPENRIEPLITAHRLELAAVDRFTIHHDFLLELLADAFEPPALRLGPRPAGENRLYRRLNALAMRQQWLPKRHVSDVADDRRRDVLIGGLAPGGAQVRFTKASLIEL